MKINSKIIRVETEEAKGMLRMRSFEKCYRHVDKVMVRLVSSIAR